MVAQAVATVITEMLAVLTIEDQRRLRMAQLLRGARVAVPAPAFVSELFYRVLGIPNPALAVFSSERVQSLNGIPGGLNVTGGSNE